MPQTNTPLRYPGGKSRLFPYVSEILKKNNLLDGHYVEPFAGGAGLAISLLIKGQVRFIHLNDLDISIYSLWYSILNETKKVCNFINDIDIDINEWKRQKNVQNNKENADLLSLGLSTLFLNRTNRSGIINAGVIGGKAQNGKYKLNARFNRQALIKKINLIAFYKSRIKIYNEDAINFLKTTLKSLPQKTLVNLDPPYYVKGQVLYQNSFEHSEHEIISNLIPTLRQYWITTYDNVEPIKQLYAHYSPIEFTLSYSVQNRYKGKELLIADPRLELPSTEILKSA